MVCKNIIYATGILVIASAAYASGPVTKNVSASQEAACHKKRLKFGTQAYSDCIDGGGTSYVYGDRKETFDEQFCRLSGNAIGSAGYDQCLQNEREKADKALRELHEHAESVQRDAEKAKSDLFESKCKSYGLKKGTGDYATCMMNLEGLDRQDLAAKTREANETSRILREQAFIESQNYQAARQNQLIMGLGLLGNATAPIPPRPQAHCTTRYFNGQQFMDCY